MTFYIGVDLHKTQFTMHVRTEEMIESLNEIKMYPTTKQDTQSSQRESEFTWKQEQL